jgi:hypothetical protein
MHRELQAGLLPSLDLVHVGRHCVVDACARRVHLQPGRAGLPGAVQVSGGASAMFGTT